MSPKPSADTPRCTVVGRGSYAETLRKATSRPKERVARYPKNMHPYLQRQLASQSISAANFSCQVRGAESICSFSKEQRGPTG